MQHWKGHFFNILVCPYCQGSLIKEQNWLVCRFHKLGYPIQQSCVDFRRGSAKHFSLEDIASMRKT